jgi:hypothetical protein
MAFDIKRLRTAAAREQRDLEKARGSLAAAVAKGEALGEGATGTRVSKAVADVHKAGDRIVKLADHVSIHLAPATPDEVLGALERDVPLVLLPVRLETRVVEQPRGQWQLLVRIYPDAIHSDTHEPGLTQAEEDAGLAFWTHSGSERDAAWAGLIALVGPQRAAWIAEATRTDPVTGSRVHSAAIAGSRFTRPAWADTLPDQFVFIVRADGAELPLQQGARIRSPVATGPDPRLVPNSDDGTDAGMRWMTDFDSAVAQGLGARIALGAKRPKLIDEVLAFGVRATSTPAGGAQLMGGLLDAHRYSDGLELLPVGTPSNSTSVAASGYSSDRLAQAEATPTPSGPTIAPSADGARIAGALGLDGDRMAGVRGAEATAEADAQAMLTALWPGTLGYFLQQMVSESVTAEEADLLRAHAINWVRARGPLAPLRAGRNPYAVLPVTSLAQFVPDTGDTHADRFVALLRSLAPAWRKAAGQVPKAGRGDPKDATAALAEILALSPVSTAIDARRIYPDGVLDIVTGLSGMDERQQSTVSAVQRQLVQGSLTALGSLQDGDGLLKIVGAGTARTVTIPRVQVPPLSPTDPLVDNYLSWLRSATPDEIAREEERFGAPLLYLLARYALLHQYARAAATNPGVPAGLDRDAWLDRHVVVDIPGSLKPPRGVLDLFGTKTASVPGGANVLPLGQKVQELAGGLSGQIEMGAAFDDPLLRFEAGTVRGRPTLRPGRMVVATGPAGSVMTVRTGAPGKPTASSSHPATAADPGAVEAAQVLAALDHLAPLASAKLDRLLRETLDLGSHRLDAWVTSLATMRLSRMRSVKAGGAHLGAYGIAMSIVPAAPGAMVKPPGSPAATPDAAERPNQGFLPAPSLGHAATAAVLRSAHAAHGDGAPFAVTLESRRVRRAKQLLDGVREGQPLAALLGYQLERALLDLGAASAIAKLRDAAPLRTSAAPPPAGTAFEQVAPRDVVDGLRIARGNFTRPVLTTGEAKAVDGAIADLRDALDATGDLLLAEGVHQIVAGTPARAAVATQAAAGMGPPPDRYDVLTSPRSGTGLNQRVLLVSDSTSEDWVAAAERTPRVLADPLLEGWAVSRLGGPQDYSAVVKFSGPDGKPLKDLVEVPLAELGIGALDVIAMSSAAADGQLCELERRVLDCALAPARRPNEVPVDARAVIAGRAEHAETSKRIPLADLIVAALSAGALLGSVRIAAAHELDPALAFNADAYDMNDLSKRLAAIVGVAEPIRDTLERLLDKKDDAKVDLDALAAALRAASLLLASAFPEVADTAHPQARSRLVAEGRGTLAELDRRLAAADALVRARSLGSGTAEAAIQLREIAELLIDNAPPMTPQLLAPVAQALGALLAKPPSLGAGATTAAERSSVIRAFLARAGTVRPGVARLGESETIAVALGRAPMELRMAQSGTPAGDPWVGLPVTPIPGGVTSMVVAGSAAFDAAAPVSALTIDDWAEVVPREREVSALAVHTERPNNDAPQAILIAVPPDPARAWDVATLRGVLDETVELAQMRIVDPPALGQFGHLLPALLLACTGRQGHIKVPEKQFFPRLTR